MHACMQLCVCVRHMCEGMCYVYICILFGKIYKTENLYYACIILFIQKGLYECICS